MRMSEEQKEEIRRLYGEYLTMKGKLPSEKQIRDDIKNNKILNNRKPLHIKLWINNRQKEM